MSDANPRRRRWHWLEAIDAAPLPELARRVLLAIATFMNALGEAHPSYDAIARRAGVARSTAAIIVAELVSGGWLERTSGGGRSVSNRYSARIPSDVEHACRTVSEGITVRQRRPARHGSNPQTVRRHARSADRKLFFTSEAPASDPLRGSPASDPELERVVETHGLRAGRDLLRRRRVGGAA